MLSAFGRRQRTAVERYREFVAAGKNQPSPWEARKNQIYLGSEQFVNVLQARQIPDRDLSEIPASQRLPVP